MSDAIRAGIAHADAAERRIRIIGIGIVLTVFVGMGLWSVLAPLASAASAVGSVAVETYRKPVQHLEGGIVKAIYVRDGQKVSRGQVLITLDAADARSGYEVVHGQFFTNLARESRLLAQRDGRASITFDPLLLANAADPRVRESMALQEQTFRARRAAYDNEAASLRERIGQLHAQEEGVRAQKAGRAETVKSYTGELEDFRKLLADGYSDKQRVRELERNVGEAQAQLGELTSNLATVALQVSETKLRILQVQRDFQREVAEELATTQGQLFELRARMETLEPTLKRTQIRAPYSGVVLNLTVHSVGAVVRAGDTIMNIVPQDEQLVIEARVSPMDIDRVGVGQLADVQFPSFQQGRLPRMQGKLIAVSPDSLIDERAQNPQPYYLARIELLPDGVKALKQQKFELVAGMPANVLIDTGKRSLFNYLTEPLRRASRTAFLEE